MVRAYGSRTATSPPRGRTVEATREEDEMRTGSTAAASAEARRPESPPRGAPWRAHLLAAATYTVGTSGIVGILPESLTILGLGLGVLLLLLAVLIAWRAQVRHRGRVGSAPVVGGPRSVLSAWLAGGPALFYLTLRRGCRWPQPCCSHCCSAPSSMPCSASRTASSPLRARAPTPLDERTVLRHRGLLLAVVVPDPSAHAEEGGQRECEDQCEQAAGHRDQDRSSAGARPLRGAVRRGRLCHR